MRDLINWRRQVGKEYSLTLTEQEITKVFDALIERPFKEVAPLVAKLQWVYKAANGEAPADAAK
jgi:hypothetical protein